MRAYELSEKIKNADIVFDIHSTKTTDVGSNSMVIVTKLDEETKELLKIIKPPKVLHMLYNSTGALISQAKIGIAFEYGLDDSPAVLQATLHDIAEILLHYGIIKKNPYSNPLARIMTEVFEVYDIYQKDFEGNYDLDGNLKNFSLVENGSLICTTSEGDMVHANESFYPILFGKNRYTDILGFKARKIESI